ncbi:methionine ABC transporter ATP-binding protein [Streptococcus himalayensis]|uniref:Methionine import ATP-binding protein MetN n=1 Tax=Streptococcus himalayensis TaxID=1888195 RepID=A0A917A7M0_9STRE|nr:methionine ABC transporter ATP-binding protein [Streptococcus himalayensis]GGE32209.1 methionine import ATP-binding protein MetN [Streptococcus himalayensis]
MIRIEEVSKVYQTKQGEVTAVNNVSLTIEKGDIFGIIGFSGAGKSTLVRLLNGLESVSSGKIFLGGKDITSLKKKELLDTRKKISMIFQHFNLLWSRTVEDNISFPLEVAGVPKEERQKRVKELIGLVGLEGREQSYPAQLSGGQKQRVGIARALANHPEVLLCDEATSALDPKTTKDILNLLVDINKKLGLTIVMITHEMHVVSQICHKVAVMENGQVVEEGKVIDVFKHPQKAITQQFVGEERSEEDLTQVFAHLEGTLKLGVLARVQYLGDSTGTGALAEVIRSLDVSISILQGKVNITQEGPIGSLIVVIEDAEKVTAVVEQLTQKGMKVEVLEHV